MTAPSPASRKRLSAENRRAEIMQAAAHLFTTRGFEGVGMADIAQHLGTSRPTIYTYFPSTESILDALLEDLLEHLPERLRPTLQSEERISFQRLYLALTREKELLQLLNSGGGPLFRTRRAAFLSALQDRLEVRELGHARAAALGRAPQPLLLPILVNLLSSLAYENVTQEEPDEQRTLEQARVLDEFIQGGLDRLFDRTVP